MNETGLNEEARLRKENQELKERLRSMGRPIAHSHGDGVPSRLWHPSRVTILSIFPTAIVLFVIAFFAGYIPLHERSALVQAEATKQENALPRVQVVQVKRSSVQSELQLPAASRR